MNVKRYIAEDAKEAMEKVRYELGSDAYILNTRKIKRKGIFGAFKKPMYEVVAAYDPNTEKKSARRTPGAEAGVQPFDLKKAAAREDIRALEAVPPAVRGGAESKSPETAGKDVLAIRDALISDAARRESAGKNSGETLKISELERKIDSVAAMMEGLVSSRAGTDERLRHIPPEISGLVSSLEKNEVSMEFALRVGEDTAAALLRQEADPHEICSQILWQYIGDPAPIKLKKFRRNVVMLAGPTGVGKTTTLAKLAAEYSINQNVKVALITTDTYRIAAVEQLKTYAEILDLPLATAYTPEDMKSALEDFEDFDLVLIDTAGRSPNDSSIEKELTSFMAEANPDEVHLCISASTGFAGCRNILETYGFLSGHKLLFTKMDETPAWGAVINARFLTDRPISYASFGQAVPDDIEIIDAKKVTNRLLSMQKPVLPA